VSHIVEAITTRDPGAHPVRPPSIVRGIDAREGVRSGPSVNAEPPTLTAPGACEFRDPAAFPDAPDLTISSASGERSRASNHS
jgi:hypothetical protein